MAEYAAQVEAKLKALSLSPSAAQWVMKALDPVRGGPVSMPDAIQVSALVPEYKTTTVVNAPPGVGTSNWDCIIITPPSDTVAAYYATNVTGIDFATTLPSVTAVVNNAAVVPSPPDQLSGVGVHVATGAWDVAVSQYRTAASVELPASWRTVARSVTVYATGSDLYNQGTVYAGQYARPTMKCPTGASMNPGAGEWLATNIDHVALPLREQDMATMTPGFYTAGAREGVYSVHRLTGPAQEFVQPREMLAWMSPDLSTKVYSLADPTARISATTTMPRFLTDDYNTVAPVIPPTTGVSFTSTSFDDHLTWGVTIFRGLHPSMSLTIKTVATLELVPTAAAPSRQFIKPPAKFEPTAMAAYYALASELPCCMASKYNFLGAILPAISAVASKVLPFLAPVLGQGLQALGGYVASRAAPPEPQQPPPNRVVVRAPPRSRSVSVSSRRSVLKVQKKRKGKKAR